MFLTEELIKKLEALEKDIKDAGWDQRVAWYKYELLDIREKADIGNFYIRQMLGEAKYSKRRIIRDPEDSSKTKTVYEYHQDKYRLRNRTTKRVPMSVLKVGVTLAMYHLIECPESDNAYIPEINAYELGRRAGGFSVPTTKKALKALEEMKMIKITIVRRGTGDMPIYRIDIVDYKKFYASAKNGGCGYFSLTDEKFTELMEIKDVNSLRLELAMLIDSRFYDSNDHHIDFTDLYYCLPASKRHPWFVKEKRNEIKNSHFETTSSYKAKDLVCKLVYDAKKQINQKILRARKVISSKLSSCFGKYIKDKFLDNISRFASSFPVEVILSAIENASNYQYRYVENIRDGKKQKDIKNLAAVVYSICRMKIYPTLAPVCENLLWEQQDQGVVAADIPELNGILGSDRMSPNI